MCRGAAGSACSGAAALQAGKAAAGQQQRTTSVSRLSIMVSAMPPCTGRGRRHSAAWLLGCSARQPGHRSPPRPQPLPAARRFRCTTCEFLPRQEMGRRSSLGKACARYWLYPKSNISRASSLRQHPRAANASTAVASGGPGYRRQAARRRQPWRARRSAAGMQPQLQRQAGGCIDVHESREHPPQVRQVEVMRQRRRRHLPARRRGGAAMLQQAARQGQQRRQLQQEGSRGHIEAEQRQGAFAPPRVYGRQRLRSGRRRRQLLAGRALTSALRQGRIMIGAPCYSALRQALRRAIGYR